ncbi:MAG: PEGA domain-containing protein [Steroidobacteraceae bacterium]
MNVELRVRDALGERDFAAGDFPVSLGGEGSSVPLPGLPPGAAAWLALHDGQLFVQPEPGATPLALNGVTLSGSRWLRDGDVVEAGASRLRVAYDADARTLHVDDGRPGNLTLPPSRAGGDPLVGGGDPDEERIDVVAYGRAAAAQAAPRTRQRRPLVVAAFAALALVAWYFWAGHSVAVHVEPAAEVALRGGWPALRHGDDFFLLPGRYTVEASRPGYAKLASPIVVEAKAGQRYRFVLEKLPGRLQVRSPVPARVAIDGRDAGRAPGEFRLAPGEHRVVVSADRYRPFEARVRIRGENRLQALDARLEPTWARVTVLSEPAGARVSIAGRESGMTPLEVPVDAGSQRVVLRHDGYKDWSADIVVVAGKPLTVGPVKLGLPDARLAVRSTPAGASVSVGGAFRGRTPVEVEVRPDLPLEVLVARDGYEPGTQSLTLRPGERRELALALKPIYGEVTVKATPADAEVVVDGKVLGRVGQAYRLPAAPTTLEVRANGYRTYRTGVTPRPGLPQVVEVALFPGHNPPAAAGATTAPAGDAAAVAGSSGGPPPSAIRTKSGQELRLVPTGSYTMGGARREPGRRANEAERPVNLERPFYVGTREVTNAEFRQFRASHRSGFVGQQTLDTDRQPVVAVSWDEAVAYCNWLSAQEGLPAAYQAKGSSYVAVVPATTGYRLPTEAEWEWVARGAGSGALRRYPWGDALPVPAGSGNLADRSAQALLPQVLDYYDDGHPVTAPVGGYSPTALGFYDVAGNVAEWTSDLYTVQPGSSAPTTDPWAGGEGRLHVIRGSSWRSVTVSELRAASRAFGDAGRDDVGFRIARYAE